MSPVREAREMNAISSSFQRETQSCKPLVRASGSAHNTAKRFRAPEFCDRKKQELSYFENRWWGGGWGCEGLMGYLNDLKPNIPLLLVIKNHGQ